MTIFDNLDKYITNDNITCYLYMGKYNENSGTYVTDETYFNKILDKIKYYISRQHNKEQYKCYKYFEKELHVYRNNKIAFVKNPLFCNMQNNMCLNLCEEYQIDLENFPIISNYTDIYNIFNKTFTLKNIQQVEITLSNEKREKTNSEPENIYIIFIKFPIKYLDNAKKIIECIFG